MSPSDWGQGFNAMDSTGQCSIDSMQYSTVDVLYSRRRDEYTEAYKRLIEDMPGEV